VHSTKTNKITTGNELYDRSKPKDHYRINVTIKYNYMANAEVSQVITC